MPVRRFPLLSLDIVMAARTSVPVLITAPPEIALPIALEIGSGYRDDARDAVAVVDAANRHELEMAFGVYQGTDQGGIRGVVLRNVDALNRAQQLALLRLIDARAASSAPRVRVITTTSVSLFDRVVEGSFDGQLFYMLNAIHIMV